MHLAVTDGHLLTTRRIAELHDAKYNHLAKVTQWLAKEGYVVAARGRTGGIRLAKPVDEISIGELVRKLEAGAELVECMRADGGTCRLSPSCGLTGAMAAAQAAFFDVLDSYSLADVSTSNAEMRRLLASLNAA